MGSRELMAEGTALMQTKTLDELKSTVLNATAEPGIRSASAVLLMKKAKNVDDKVVALSALGIRLPLSVTDWESNWRLNFPVAAEVCAHAELMPHVIRQALDGTLPESVVIFVLHHFQSENGAPKTYLAGLLEGNLPTAERARAERIIAFLEGKRPKSEQPTLPEDQQATTTGQLKPEPSLDTITTAIAPKSDITPDLPTSQPTSPLPTPMLTIIVSALALIGLLCAVRKKQN